MTDSTDNSPSVPAPVAGPDAGRFSLNDHGILLWQKDSSNPLPGEQVGRVTKGASLLQPAAKTDDAALQERANDWLAIHVRHVLEPLFILKSESEGALTAAAADIAAKLYDHLGVVHRSDLETEIAALDPELRKALRRRAFVWVLCWCFYLHWSNRRPFVCARCSGHCGTTKTCRLRNLSMGACRKSSTPPRLTVISTA